MSIDISIDKCICIYIYISIDLKMNFFFIINVMNQLIFMFIYLITTIIHYYINSYNFIHRNKFGN